MKNPDYTQNGFRVKRLAFFGDLAMHSLAKQPEAHSATEQKNTDQNAYDCKLPMLAKK